MYEKYRLSYLSHFPEKVCFRRKTLISEIKSCFYWMKLRIKLLVNLPI